ncbi:hypothetical protein [Photobacterium sanguinicancri]|uniref:hypothetical protein n=1 Tax=Photobacterium sanguinicancri TaxID=875932 RepID=UPI0007882766|nr:hypothetical protein AS132_00770 [Photobacterium sanguinicancri]
MNKINIVGTSGSGKSTFTKNWLKSYLILITKWIHYAGRQTGLNQKELWPNSGNKESFKTLLTRKNSILLWTIKTHSSNTQRYQKVINDKQYSHIQFIRITSPTEAKRFIANAV